MTDKDPTGPDDAETGHSKLPPRAADWHSGLKSEDANKSKNTAPDTVSDFLANNRHEESPDWDPIDNAGERYRSQRSLYDSTSTIDPVEVEETPRHNTLDFYHTRTRFSDFLIGLLLGIIAFISVAYTYHGFGHSWDEALYLKPAERAAAWVVGALNSGDDAMLQRDAVDRHWGVSLDGNDPLHPEVAPIPKLLIGAGLTYLKPYVADPMVAMRLPNAILFGLTICLLFLIGSREYGRIGGFAAALFYALMPRVFGHAHIAASETPLVFFMVLTIWFFLVGNRYWPVALFTGIAFGLAVDTKITALMLPIPLMLWGQIYKRRDYASNVFAMFFIAPVIIVALWPWLWYDGIKRFIAYIIFYLDHQSTAVFYMNRLWGYSHGSAAPFYYPPHIAALSVPIWILFFLALGLIRALFSSVRRPVTILFVLMMVSWLGISMLPGAPKYDGERLFFPVFVFVALLAAGGFSSLFLGVRRWRERRDLSAASRETGYIAMLFLVLVSAYGVADIAFVHPNELNYFNWITGRAKGAYAQGFETSYWGDAVNEDVTGFLNKTLEPGDKVKTLALNELAFENLRQWGKLPEKVDFSPDYPPFDYVILQVRQGFMTTLERRLWRSVKPLKTFETDGVPRIMIFDGKDVNQFFPPSPDAATTATVSAGVAVPDVIVTEPKDVVTTGPAIEPIESRTTEPLSIAEEAVTSRSETMANVAETSESEVLDLTTSKSEVIPEEATVPMDVVTTVSTFQPMQPSEVVTSQSETYQGDLPSTMPMGLEEEDM